MCDYTFEDVEAARQAARTVLLHHYDDAETDRVMALMEHECSFGGACWLEHYGVLSGTDDEYATILLADFAAVADRPVQEETCNG